MISLEAVIKIPYTCRVKQRGLTVPVASEDSVHHGGKGLLKQNSVVGQEVERRHAGTWLAFSPSPFYSFGVFSP